MNVFNQWYLMSKYYALSIVGGIKVEGMFPFLGNEDFPKKHTSIHINKRVVKCFV